VVLNHIRENISQRRVLLYPYFKDYDRGQGFNRTVTKSQFSRIMQSLKINILMSDVEKICLKFEDEFGCGEINYPEFCQYVDNAFLHSTVEQKKEFASEENACDMPETISAISETERAEMIDRISHHVLVNRIRVTDFVRDFDPLRSGLISVSVFARVLKSLRLNLNQKQIFSLSQHYRDSDKPDMIKWRKFVDDTAPIPIYNTSECNMPKDSTKILDMDRPGAEAWDSVSPELKAAYDRVMSRFRARSNQRRVHMKPMFQDFDHHNYGYVTKNQFRQCISFLDLNADDDEKDALEARYCDQSGFRYIVFLDDVTLPEAREGKYERQLARMMQLNINKKPSEVYPEDNPEIIMERLQAFLFRNRVRAIDAFIDFDKLRTGRITRINFLRALKALIDTCLLESEREIVANQYQTGEKGDYVDYRRFCHDMVKCDVRHGMEMDPLAPPVDYKLPSNLYSNELAADMEPIYVMAMNRLAEHIRRTRAQLHPIFEDYDRVHNGTVSRSQFHRVLSELEMGGLLNEQEFRLIFIKFGIRRGAQFDVNYMSFCETVYEKAKHEVRYE